MTITFSDPLIYFEELPSFIHQSLKITLDLVNEILPTSGVKIGEEPKIPKIDSWDLEPIDKKEITESDIQGLVFESMNIQLNISNPLLVSQSSVSWTHNLNHFLDLR